MTTADLISGAGVTLILAAFALSTLKKLDTNSSPYFVLNMLGGGLACVGAWLVGSIPFMVLELVWTLVALLGLIKLNKTVSS
ncbi:MAG: hypothetical protein IT270_18340 [Saprospiraceae bacterium]|nr:hypothetical protein [Saprospiraceae bacterium]